MKNQALVTLTMGFVSITSYTLLLFRFWSVDELRMCFSTKIYIVLFKYNAHKWIPSNYFNIFSLCLYIGTQVIINQVKGNVTSNHIELFCNSRNICCNPKHVFCVIHGTLVDGMQIDVLLLMIIATNFKTKKS
jgi:hypothetical protein